MTQAAPSKTEAPIDVLEDPEPGASSPAVARERVGFLPIQTNWFDRIFISVVIWVALSLLWFRFVEPLGLSIWISNLIALALAVVIVRKG